MRLLERVTIVRRKTTVTCMVSWPVLLLNRMTGARVGDFSLQRRWQLKQSTANARRESDAVEPQLPGLNFTLLESGAR